MYIVRFTEEEQYLKNSPTITYDCYSIEIRLFGVIFTPIVNLPWSKSVEESLNLQLFPMV